KLLSLIKFINKLETKQAKVLSYLIDIGCRVPKFSVYEYTEGILFVSNIEENAAPLPLKDEFLTHKTKALQVRKGFQKIVYLVHFIQHLAVIRSDHLVV
ncbi:hypothetical protein BWI93_01365, partial [Siphonobacter sp. BAB-5385]|uniref:hypothetical protein n=1 Tax=Siphonobacter sp. BAB-5385 TaxID=1864822 RepID=UPI000BD2BB00